MKPQLHNLLLCTAVAFACHASLALAFVAEQDSSEPLIAAQIHVLGGTTWEDVGIELDKLRQAGYNAVFFRAFQNRGDRYHALAAAKQDEGAVGLYYRSTLAPTVADILPRLADMCRARGLRFYAWMSTRRMDWLDRQDWHDLLYNLATGNLVAQDHYDLFNPDFTDYLLRLFEELAAQPVDGIVLQDDFVIKTYEGFTPASLESFSRQNAFQVSPQEMFAETFTGADGRLHARNHGESYLLWCMHKADRLRILSEALSARCRKSKVNLELILSVYYDTVLRPEEALCWLGQDLDLITASPFDRFCLMAYHRQIAEEQQLTVSEAIALTDRLVAQLYGSLGDRLIVKLQAVDWSKGEPIESAELKQLLDAIAVPVSNWAVAPVDSGTSIGLEAAQMLAARSGEER
jgi:biofilm PGA synthesis lipoprotein PgaB